jgi:hypothetical protein
MTASFNAVRSMLASTTIVLALHSSAPALANHLTPDSSVFAVEPYVDDMVLRSLLKDAYTPDVRLRAVVVRGMMRTSFAVGVKERGKGYLVFAESVAWRLRSIRKLGVPADRCRRYPMSFAEMIDASGTTRSDACWGLGMYRTVTNHCEGPISANDARRLISVWGRVLAQTNDKPQGSSDVLDGAIYHFSLPPYPPIDPLKAALPGQYTLAGQTYSPDGRTDLGAFTHIAGALNAYCWSKGKAELAEVNRTASALLNRLKTDKPK